MRWCVAQRGADLEQLSGDVAALDGPDVKAAQLARQGAQRWAAAAGEASVETLQAALVAAERAKAELVTAHMGYLRKLAMQFSRQVCCWWWRSSSPIACLRCNNEAL